ncbi:MAG TPA: cytochrome d ubiquinol oxidase subunit II [Acidimicrobiia bacterium]|nr:cytochrome d ubiquinol oxidase subunit II [Acidimicrobiia bacterium]
MTSADTLMGITWAGMTAYVILGGADFGGGFWDLAAGGTRRGADQRRLIERVIGPVWEANHVWLIFVIVVLWTAFPAVFAAVFSTMYLPLTGAAVGIILRGAGFAFRKSVEELPLQRLFGVTFATSSILTPFLLGTVAGGIASGRVPLGNATGDLIHSWVNPTSILGGTMAVVVCAYLAAVFLTADAARYSTPRLVEAFRIRALGAAAVAGALALAGIAVLRKDAPTLYQGLTGGAAWLVLLSVIAGVAAVVFLVLRRFWPARVASVLAVMSILWGWAVAQYPYMLAGQITIQEAAAHPATLDAMLVSLTVGAILLVPSMVLLFVMFQRTAPGDGAGDDVTPQLPADLDRPPA